MSEEERKAIALSLLPSLLATRRTSNLVELSLEAFNLADAFLQASKLRRVDYCVAGYLQEGEECPCLECRAEMLD